jgi:hypothetical protein
MPKLTWIACIVLAATSASNLSAEVHCPGNVSSVPYRVVNRHQMVIAVSVNHSGPYPFLLDTGTQVTMIDPALAGELHLVMRGEAAVASAGLNATASFSQLEATELGPHEVSGMKVLVYELSNLQASGLNVRGVLGEDFLQRFDLLIDNAHSLLCLDDSGAMRAEVKGERVPLVEPSAVGDGTLAKSLIVSVRLSDSMRPVRLKLDSGADVPFLYNTSEYMALGAFQGASLHGGGANGAQRVFTALPLQTMKIGRAEVSRVQFVTLAGAKKDARTSEFDGLLTMGLFRRVFIDHADRLAVLDPQ